MATGLPHDAIAGSGETAGNGTYGGPPAGQGQPGSGWTAGRIVAVVAGSLLMLVSLGLLGGGGTLMWADQTQRQHGYVTAAAATYSTTGYALASDRIELDRNWLLTGFIGQVRVRVTATDPAKPVLVAIGPAAQVSGYLSGASYTTVTSTGAGGLTVHQGTAIPVPPERAGIWTVRVAGTGTQTLRWTAEAGDWMLVAMNTDGSPGLTVHADAGVQAPWLFRLAIQLMVGGIVLGLLSAALIAVPVRLASGAR